MQVKPTDITTRASRINQKISSASAWAFLAECQEGGAEDTDPILPLQSPKHKKEMNLPMPKAAPHEFTDTPPSPTYWNFKSLLGVIQHLDFDGHEFS